MAGRPSYEPSDKQRGKVEAMSAVGIPQEDIARELGIGADTLRKYFADELANAATRANAKVAGTLFKMATSGKDTAATIFWCKTRMGWREKEHVPEALITQINFFDDASQVRPTE